MTIPLATVHPLNEAVVETPCPVAWAEMTGNDKVRFCSQCQKSVHNFSEMTSAEIVQLIQENEARLCVQLVRTEDGSVLTADGPVGWRWRLWNRLRRMGSKSMAWAASLFALFFLPGCPAGGNMRRPDMKSIMVAPDANGSKTAGVENTQEKLAPVPPQTAR